MRFVAYAIVGLIAFLALHILVVWEYAPHDAIVPDPVRLTRAPSVAGEATLLFAGDTGEVDAALPTLLEKGFEYPFSLTVDLVRDADLAVANLEAPITGGGDEIPVYTKYVYRAPPASAKALAWAGVDLVTLANNHAVDYGRSGIFDTMKNVRAAGVELIGASPSGDGEARRGAIVTIGELRVGVLAYCEDQLLFRVWVDLFARRGHGGVAALTRANLAGDVARLRPQVDLLVVALHAGNDYAPPAASTIDWAERAVDLGADLVVVHHPHVAHPVLLHHGRPILLSLGNYAWGAPGHDDLDYGWLALAHARGRRFDRVELVPLAVQNRRVAFRPEPLDGEERTRAIGKLIDDSRRYGAEMREERGRAIVDL
jgi:poly-gamma-glutamate synthesis protein (capsule biosynthesis protein)